MKIRALPRAIVEAVSGRALRSFAPAILKALSSITESQGGWYRIFESYAGAWQQNVTVDYDTALSNSHDFAAKTLIAGDIAKLRVKLVQRDADSGVWIETDNWSYRTLVKPNHFQTRIQFFESWMTSKLQRGNAYILKRRDSKNSVVALYVLDPSRVTPMIADNGDVFYDLQMDKLSGISQNRVLVPAREIIHDRFNCMFHPLVGISPIFASALSGQLGIEIQRQATKFFQNGARPSGILTAPGAIEDATAARLKEAWDTKFSGENAGRVAVLGDGLKYEAMGAKASDSQLIEQLKLTGEIIATVYHVPPYKIGVGPLPAYNNIQALNVEYYGQCLQRHIEDIEILLDEGLGLNGESSAGRNLGVEFDIDGLLRMDSASQLEVLDKAKSVLTLNERRKRLEMPKLKEGGDTVYLQQQDHSVEAIAARDAQLIEAVENPPEPPPVTPPAPPANDDAPVDGKGVIADMLTRALA